MRNNLDICINKLIEPEKSWIAIKDIYELQRGCLLCIIKLSCDKYFELFHRHFHDIWDKRVATIARNSTRGEYIANSKKKIKKEKILLQKRGRDNPANFGEIHSLLNRFEVFSVNYLCRYFLTFLKTKTVPKVTVLGVTNSTARKCKQNTTKWNKIIWSVSPRGLFSTLPNIYDRALSRC